MLDRAGILALIPQAGASCLLDRLLRWSEADILCEADTHLDPANPLRRAGALNPLCGAEYGLQAAALHGALRGGAPQPAGWLASLRGVEVLTPRLDDPAHGTLQVAAELQAGSEAALAYGFRLLSQSGTLLLQGRGTVALRPVAGDAAVHPGGPA